MNHLNTNFTRDDKHLARAKNNLPLNRLSFFFQTYPTALSFMFGFIVSLSSLNTIALPSDKEEKIYISMEGKMQIDAAKERAIYSKNVVVTQGTLEIGADQLELYGNVNNPKKIIAIGSPARLQQQPSAEQAVIVVTGNRIEYSVATGKVQIITNAQFEQDGTVIQASKLFYDVSNSYVEADADGSSINMVIPPKKNIQHQTSGDDAELPTKESSSPESLKTESSKTETSKTETSKTETP